jgi:hypothetical protein
MKRTYQIEERKAIQRFRSHLTSDPGKVQLILPLAEIANDFKVASITCCSKHAAWTHRHGTVHSCPASYPRIVRPRITRDQI